MKEFEYGIKRTFTGKMDQTYSVDLRGVKDDPDNDIIDDTITIKMWVSVPANVPLLLRDACYRSALRTVFDHVCCQIEKLVDDQTADVSEKGLSVKVIITPARKSGIRQLIKHRQYYWWGGSVRTDTSTIAWRSLMHKAGSACCKSMERTCPDIATKSSSAHATRWSSICRGATLWGLEHSQLTAAVKDNPTVTSRLSRYSYGLQVATPYDPSKHLVQDRFYDKVVGTYKADNQMDWLLKRVRHSYSVVVPQTEITKG